MTILPNIEEAMEDARNGKLSPYWQNNLKRECLHIQTEVSQFGIYFEIPTRRHLLRST